MRYELLEQMVVYASCKKCGRLFEPWFRGKVVGIIGGTTREPTTYQIELDNGYIDHIHEDQIVDIEKPIHHFETGNKVYTCVFDATTIENEKEENENMAALTGYTAVAVIEQGYYNKEYFYAIYPDGHDYIPDEKVLVSNNKDIWDIKEIISLEEAAERHKGAIAGEIVCAVDTYAYEERVANRKEAGKLKKEMDKMIKQMDETMKYNMYAEKNPELKKKLDEYKRLTGK